VQLVLPRKHRVAPAPLAMGKATARAYIRHRHHHIAEGPLDVDAYLKRIDFSGPVRHDVETLARLHHAHLTAIPYEDIDVQLGRPVTIELGPIYEKIVRRGRGGWCYEMNGIFGWALGELGFKVHRGASGVMREGKGDAAVGNHLVLPVKLDDGFVLADVGFGDGPTVPIRLVEGSFNGGLFTYGLKKLDDHWWRLLNHPQGAAPSFDFNLAIADEALLARQCGFLQTAEMSPFVQNLVCQRYAQGHFHMLRGRVLRRLDGTSLDEHLIADEKELLSVLGSVFGLDVPEAASLWPKICERHEAVFAQAKPN
jgi:N-hydroxyarylamine O-acetyltransferase